MTGVGSDSPGRLIGRPWVIVGLLLAVAATVALAFADQARWLKLGIVAALWAALIGTFVAAKYRRQVARTEEAQAQAQSAYELELEREIAARREYELQIEAETRQRVEAESRDQLDALHAEVTSLRESLQALFGGEVLYERVALTAQSTRMRSLHDESPVVAASENNGSPTQLAYGEPDPGTAERPTELIGQVPPAPAAEQQRPYAAAETSQDDMAGDHGRAGSGARPHRPDTGMPAGSTAARAAMAAGQARADSRVPAQSASAPASDEPDLAGATGAALPHRQPREPHAPTGSPQSPEQPSTSQQPPMMASGPSSPASREGTRPAMERPDQSAMVNPSAPTGSAPTRSSQPERPAETAEPSPAQAGSNAARASGFDLDWTPSWEVSGGHAQESTPSQASATQDNELPQRAGAHRAADADPPAAQDPPPQSGMGSRSTLPEEYRGTGGRRRRAEPAEPAGPAEAAGGVPSGSGTGGRRRKPDDAPAWQATLGTGGGRHASAADEEDRSMHQPAYTSAEQGQAVPEAAEPNSESSSEERPQSEGSHAAGRSVNELLAAYGAADTSPRRRRRAED